MPDGAGGTISTKALSTGPSAAACARAPSRRRRCALGSSSLQSRIRFIASGAPRKQWLQASCRKVDTGFRKRSCSTNKLERDDDAKLKSSGCSQHTSACAASRAELRDPPTHVVDSCILSAEQTMIKSGGKRVGAPSSGRSTLMKAIRNLVLACVAALAATDALAQADLRAPLPQPLTIKQGMLNVPALSPLWLLPEQAAKYNIQIETVMFQRFADARTALVSGDIHLTAFGPQDISLALGQGAKTLVGVAGVGSGNDCLVVRKGEDIRD